MARTPSKHRKINRGIKPPTGQDKVKKKSAEKKKEPEMLPSVAKLMKQETTHRHLGKSNVSFFPSTSKTFTPLYSYQGSS